MPNRLGDIQKARLEVANFENFLHLGSITFDRYQSQEPPEPDIIAWRDGAAFGIELTNFHRRSEKQIESEEDRVLERALAIYNSRRGPSLLLSLMWAPHFKVCQTVREEIAEKIATLALNNTPSPNQWIILGWNQFDRQLMCAVDHIALYASPDGVPAHWDTGMRGGCSKLGFSLTATGTRSQKGEAEEIPSSISRDVAVDCIRVWNTIVLDGDE